MNRKQLSVLILCLCSTALVATLLVQVFRLRAEVAQSEDSAEEPPMTELEFEELRLRLDDTKPDLNRSTHYAVPVRLGVGRKLKISRQTSLELANVHIKENTALLRLFSNGNLVAEKSLRPGEGFGSPGLTLDSIKENEAVVTVSFAH